MRYLSLATLTEAVSAKFFFDFSYLSPDSWLGKLARAPLSIVPENLALPILQGPLRGSRWIVGSGTHGYWLGWYEREIQQAFVKHVRRGDTVFDIGGHVGYYTLLAATLSGPDGTVIVFEPSAQNLEYLKSHLAINKLNNVELVQAAVASSTGKVRFQPGATSSTGKIEECGDFIVDAVSLDDLYTTHRLPAPHVIKMDIEGAEVEALKGGRYLLSQTHPTIFLSTHGIGVRQQCCALLSSLGYSIRPLDSQSLERSSELLATWIP